MCARVRTERSIADEWYCGIFHHARAISTATTYSRMSKRRTFVHLLFIVAIRSAPHRLLGTFVLAYGETYTRRDESDYLNVETKSISS